MDDNAATSPANTPPSGGVWSWLKHPWQLLIFGSVISLGLWVGIGVWIEHRRARAFEELMQTSGIVPIEFGRGRSRYPIWLPNLIGNRLPEEWKRNVLIEIPGCWFFERSLTDRELRLFDQVSGVASVEFKDPRSISDKDLLHFIEQHPLQILQFNGSRKLTPQHLGALARHEHIRVLEGVLGPFDQPTLDGLARIASLRPHFELRLDGPIEKSVRVKPMSSLATLEWDHSDLTDDQFAGLAAGLSPRKLVLRETCLTTKSWPLLEKMPLQSLELESPHLDDAILPSVLRLRQLEGIRLRGGYVPRLSVEKLMMTLPELTDVDIQ